MTGFPTDDMTLRLLAEACRLNPDTERSHLADFLEMGAKVSEVVNEETGESFSTLEEAVDAAGDGTPTFLVKHEEGHEPHSPQSVILSLIEEIQHLRGHES